MVGTSLYVIKNTLNVILGLKIPPTLLQNFLKLLETNLRQFLLLYLHVLLVFLAELHRSQIVKVKTQDKTTHRVQVNCFNLLIQRQKQNRIRCTKKSCNVIKQDKELMMSIEFQFSFLSDHVFPWKEKWTTRNGECECLYHHQKKKSKILGNLSIASNSLSYYENYMYS